jgi:serine/threonine protein phosphatase PrpC
MSKVGATRRTGAVAFGASVAGPAHEAAGVPNQDTWLSSAAAGWRVVAVADGLGSRANASEGSRAACAAAVEAVRAWRRTPAAPLDVLVALVHLLWRARVAPREPSTCATTCLFAALGPDGAGAAAQLGDGLVLVRDGEGLRPLRERPPGDFVNETDALGVTKQTSAWATRGFAPGARSIVLCTDGVADDLLPGKHDEFVAWATNHAERPPRARGAALRAALRAWPTPAHTDDKTVAVIEVAP